jgi:transcriptional regulator with XRE-family HTH domain
MLNTQQTGWLLRTVREELGLTMGDAQRATGLPLTEISNIEFGRSFSSNNYRKLYAYLESMSDSRRKPLPKVLEGG